MSDNKSEGPTLRAPTEEDKSLVFAFLKMMKEVEIPTEQAELVTMTLAENFKVDPNGVGGTHDLGIDLSKVWADAVAANAGGGGDPMKDEKFIAFLDLLKKKGYFNNCSEGTEEHDTRVKKAHAKFLARNNPYAGLSAEQLKAKGNELVGSSNFKEALAYYSKAIEQDPSNHIYFSNRAAAHSFLKDYRAAILDCEKAISINHTYPKAHSRLGHALFHEGQFTRAAVSYRQAANLDPSNEQYKIDLKLAEDQMQTVVPQGGAAPAGGAPGGWPMMPGMGAPGAGGAGGMPGMPPGMDMDAMNSLMQNPEFMSSAMKMMQNPNFGSMMQSMQAGQAPDPQAMQQMMGEMGPMARPQVNGDGTMTTPFGTIHQDDLKELLEKEDNPKFAAIREDVQANGMGAFQKYSQDPEFLNLTMKLMAKAGERKREAGGDAGQPSLQ